MKVKVTVILTNGRAVHNSHTRTIEIDDDDLTDAAIEEIAAEEKDRMVSWDWERVPNDPANKEPKS